MSNFDSLIEKDPEERLLIPFEFLEDLSAEEIIVSAVVTCECIAGVDANPDRMIQGIAAIGGTVVEQMIIGGIKGVIYRLKCMITTSLNQTLVLKIKMPITNVYGICER